jgi:hypothetical protein
MINVTLPKEQWEAVVKAIDLGLKGFKPAEQVLGKYKDKMNVTDAEIIKVQEEIIKDYAEELDRLKKYVEETENNRHIEPVAWMSESKTIYHVEDFAGMNKDIAKNFTIPLYTHPAKPSICVGYWDSKTGAFHKKLTEIQQKRLNDGFLKPVYTAGMLPAKTLNKESE